MLRWALLLCLAGCDKGPIREHRIHYEMGGLGSKGPVMYRADIDLDKASLVASIDTKTTERMLDPAMKKELDNLAACTRDEKQGPDPRVSDMYEKLVLYGDVTKAIEQSGPMTAPCSSKLAARIETLAGWHE
jgi:hypothetical protein